MRTSLIAIWSCAAVALAQSGGEPVGLLLTAGRDARITRRDAKSSGPARVGEILLAGDRLNSAGSTASYLYCPEKSTQVLAAKSEAVFESTGVQIRTGKVESRQPVSQCFLPQVVQLAVASQQHAGALVARDVPPVPALLYPIGTPSPVLDTPPLFAWEPVEKADTYRLEVSNSAGVVLWTQQIPGTQAQYPAHAPPLVAPSIYTWKVTALAGGKPLAATESQLRILSVADRRRIRQEIADAQKIIDEPGSSPAARLAKAVMLERNQLLPDALDEYKTLQARWKEAGWLQAKVVQLQDALRAAQRTVAIR